MSYLKTSPKRNIKAFYAGIKSRFFLVVFAVTALLSFCAKDSFSLPLCSTISYPEYPKYFTNCNFPGCTNALSTIDSDRSNCELPNCSVPLLATEIPNVNCMLPNCPNPISGTAKPETNCSLPLCPTTLGQDKIPMVTCSFPPCTRPVLAATDQPGINCSVPMCSVPLASKDVPRVNCMLPRCSNETPDKFDVTCTLRPCADPPAPGEDPEVNCAMRLCLQPLSGSDRPGENCTIRKCRNREELCSGRECEAVSAETPGVNCMMPECLSLPATTEAKPGTNCLYKSPVLGKLVPMCTDSVSTRNRGVNCMDAIMLPLCSTINPSDVKPLKNCIKTCGEPGAGIRAGIDCALPKCSSLGATIAAQPGINCLYSINGRLLPVCRNNSFIPQPKHRINCADIIDLPLCTEMGKEGQDVAQPGKNCVKQCSEIVAPIDSSTLVRGIDYAVHNVDCAAFCSNDGVSTPTAYCSLPGCHQVASPFPNGSAAAIVALAAATASGNAALIASANAVLIASKNCRNLGCDLLTPEELNSAKFFSNPTNKYCDGSDIKCYNFKLDQLPFLISRSDNTMCTMNTCKPDRSVCSLADDTLNISNQGEEYATKYRTQFYGNQSLSSTYTCTQQLCMPIIHRPYRCLPENDPAAIIRNQSCDYSGEGAECRNAYCYKTIDCNSQIFRNEPECKIETSSNGNVTSVGTIDDVTNAWFFRPSPMDKAYKDDDTRTFRRMNREHICYNKADMEAQPESRTIDLFGDSSALYNYTGFGNWGAQVIMNFGALGNLDLGYFHSSVLPDHTRSPGMCEGGAPNLASKLGGRGFTIEYLCGNRGVFWNRVSPNTAYFSGYTKTTFLDNNAVHQVKLCLRFKNIMRPDDLAGSGETCGARECAINCGFGACAAQTCGEDVCRTLTIKNSNPRACVATDRIMDDRALGLKHFLTVAAPVALAGALVIAAPAAPFAIVVGTGVAAGAVLSSGVLDDPLDSIYDTSLPADSKECLKNIGPFLRVRAAKYGNYICGFVDAKGPPAFNNIFFNGSEKIFENTPHPTCVSGAETPDANGACHGYNTNDYEASNHMWRTLIKVPYISNNRPSGETAKGYLDFDGRLFREQECAKVQMRVAPPDMYNLGNTENSYKIFSPPIYILHVSTRKDGPISQGSGSNTLGSTDFHYPEIQVKFGNTTAKLSLGIGQTGYESEPPAGSFVKIKSATSPDFETEVMVRKDFRETTGEPLFCLYRRITNSRGAYLTPLRLECVLRKFPEIDGLVKTVNNLLAESRRVVITEVDGNAYNKAKINFQFLSGTKESYTNAIISCATARNSCINACGNGVARNDCVTNCYKVENRCRNNCNATGNSCTTAITLENLDPNVATCSIDSERYRICVQRDPCSKIHYECTKNELDLHNAKVAEAPTGEFLNIRKECVTEILKRCNAKFGIISSTQTSVLEAGASDPHPYAYGWFNEICITSSSFKPKLRTVVAKISHEGMMGKCLIDPTSPNMAAGQHGCDDGGKAPGCKCLQYSSDMNLEIDEESRQETPHEAGLCIEIPKAKICQPIKYATTPNFDLSDIDFVKASMRKESCNTIGSPSAPACYSSEPKYCGESGFDPTNCINASHKNRTNVVNPNDTSKTFPIVGHSEFEIAMVGMENVGGQCKGFWKESFDGGNILTPKASCAINTINGQAEWVREFNPCVRYSCPLITINEQGIDSRDGYAPGFALGSESGQSLGAWNGYATWPKFTKTNDLPEKVTATACIPGFKKKDSYPEVDQAKYDAFVASNPDFRSKLSAESSSITKAIHSRFGLLKGTFTGGTFPQRYCSQIGTLSSVDRNTECQRVTCPAIAPEAPGIVEPTDPTEKAEWRTKWKLVSRAGGATFPEGKASRSKNRIENSSVVTSDRRIYAVDGNTITSHCREDLGFTQMSNESIPTIECDNKGNWSDIRNPCVTRCGAVTDATSHNGFAYWREVTNVTLGSTIDGVSNGCAAGYIPNPYPPSRDKENVYLGDAIANDLTRAALPNPVRVCAPRNSDGTGSNVWKPVVAPCVNGCPGVVEGEAYGTESATVGYAYVNGAQVLVDGRYGAGVTKAKFYNSDGTIGEVSVPWRATPFGGTAEFFYPSTQQDASYYALNPSSGTKQNRAVYAARRYCNPITHKWDEPVTSCAVNGGIVTEHIVGTTDTKLIPVGGSIAATGCNSGSRGNAAYPMFTCNQLTVGNVSPINHVVLSQNPTRISVSMNPPPETYAGRVEGCSNLRFNANSLTNPNGFLMSCIVNRSWRPQDVFFSTYDARTFGKKAVGINFRPGGVCFNGSSSCVLPENERLFIHGLYDIQIPVCVPHCSLANNTKFGTDDAAIYTGSSIINIDVGTTIALSCNANTGHSFNSICGDNSTRNAGASPSVTCDSNGNLVFNQGHCAKCNCKITIGRGDGWPDQLYMDPAGTGHDTLVIRNALVQAPKILDFYFFGRAYEGAEMFHYKGQCTTNGMVADTTTKSGWTQLPNQAPSAGVSYADHRIPGGIVSYDNPNDVLQVSEILEKFISHGFCRCGVIFRMPNSNYTHITRNESSFYTAYCEDKGGIKWPSGSHLDSTLLYPPR